MSGFAAKKVGIQIVSPILVGSSVASNSSGEVRQVMVRDCRGKHSTAGDPLSMTVENRIDQHRSTYM